MNNTAEMIFIVGNSRSGTTMLSRILGGNPSVYSLNELHFIENLISPEQINNDYRPQKQESKEIIATLLRTERDSLYSNSDIDEYLVEASKILSLYKDEQPTAMQLFSFFCSYEAKTHNKLIPCEQTPKNIYYVNEILTALPNSKFINMYRDPRDVLLSQKLRWKRRFLGAKNVPFFRETLRSWLNYHPITMSKLWRSAVNESDILTHKNSEYLLNVQFESLLSQPSVQIKRICDFLDIDFHEDMSNVPQVGSSSGKDNDQNRGIDKSRQGNWDNGGLTKGEIGVCQAICGNEMESLGYKKADVGNLWFWWLFYSISFCFKMTGALILNFKRTKNLLSTVKRRFGWSRRS